MNNPAPHGQSPRFADLNPGTHLVLDNTTVADTYRLRRRVHPPRREPHEPVLVPAAPWDGLSVTPLHVVYDAGRDRWRMWYQAHDPRLEAERKKLGKSKYGNVGEPQPIYCCYAESADGIRWERPALRIYGDTNIVFKGFSYVAGNTFLERPDAPPAERYLMANCEWRTEQQGGIYIARSPDGLHWRYPSDEPLIHGESDTWNCLAWNPDRQVYMLYLRGWHCAAVNWPALGKGNPRRRVSYSESRDLQHWTEPQQILTPDELDTNDFYALQVFRYGDQWLGQLWIYDDDRGETIEIELVWSRDGIHWSRLPDRQRFIPHGRPGDPDGYMVVPAQQPVVLNDRIVHYYTGHPEPHGRPGRTSSSFRTTLRLDGFISLDAGKLPGALITRPFTLQNDRITINAAAPYGEIIAELVEPYDHDPEGKPIAGLAAKDFEVFRGDAIAHPLSWRGTSDLRPLRGKRLLLRILMQRAELYSFTV